MADDHREADGELGEVAVGPGDDPVDAAASWDGRDPAFIESIMPLVAMALRWFDPEVRGFERLPERGPFLIVGNHSGGAFMPDYWAVLERWVRERGPDAPLYSLGFDLLFTIPGLATLSRKLGTVPAKPGTASALLDRGVPVLVYPGGDADDYRPWTERHRVDLRGRTGFVRLALRHGVPVVPLVSHGSHDALIVVARGDELSRSIGLDRFRLNVLPLVLGPAGVWLMPMAGPPLPAKVISQFCEPFDWSDLGPDAADDDEVVRHCYEEILGRMQAHLGELVDEVPHPVRSRIGTALGLDRIRGRMRPS